MRCLSPRAGPLPPSFVFSPIISIKCQDARPDHADRSRHIGDGPGYQLSPPGGGLQTAPISPSNNVWQHTWNIANQGSSPEPWCPGFLLGVGHVGTADSCYVPDLSLQPFQRSSWYYVAQSPLTNHTVSVTIWPGSTPPGKQRHSFRQDILGA